MSVADRRRALRTLASVALLPIVMSGASLRADAGRIVALPAGPMILRRVVERDLPDGNRLIVTREWECGFTRQGRTTRVEGRQIAVRVDAPPRLDQLAQIERERTIALFPLLLDQHGLLASATPQADQSSVDRAVVAAQEVIAKSGWSPGEQRDAGQFLTRVANGAAEMISATPPDLFYPASPSGHDTRTLPLPDGGQAIISVDIAVEADPATGLMRRMDKRIVTRIDGQAQLARELWELAPA